MSFKAKITLFLRYGAGITAGLILQYFILKEILKLKSKNIKIFSILTFFFFNSLILLVPLDFISGTTLPSSIYVFIVSTAIIWQVVSGSAYFVFVIYKNTKKLIFRLKHKNRNLSRTQQTDIERRAFIYSSVTASVMLYPSIKSVNNAIKFPEIKRITVKIPNLSEPSLKIVQLTDLHTGYFMTTEKLQNITKAVNAENPDIVVLTGDQLHGNHPPFLNHLSEGLKGLTAKYGVWQIAGNHDHRLGTKYLFEKLKKINIKPLDNRSVFINLPHGKLELIGIDDLMYGGDFYAVKRKTNRDIPSVLLSHRPDILDIVCNHDIDLVLSGHTHGGQINIAGFSPSIAETPYTSGIYTKKNTVLYVSPGLGVTGIPMRLGAPAEISIITLIPDKKS